MCDPCSLQRAPIPSIGLTTTVRICDRCYNDPDGLLHKAAINASINSGISEQESGVRRDDISTDKPERHRQKRSAVVDELAQRVQASGLACS